MSSGDRMLQVLSLFTVDRSELTVDQAAQILKSTPSTTYRYFASLVKAGLIAPSGFGRYIVGPAAIQLDWLMRNTDPLIAAARPAITILSGAIDQPAALLLCRLYHGTVMCLARENISNPPFGVSYQRGRPMPLFRGAASKVVLANLSDRALRAAISRDQAEMGDVGLGRSVAEIRKALRAIRAAGVCVTSGELDAGLTGVAAPVLLRDGSPIGSLGVVIADKEAAPQTVQRFSRLLASAAAQISTSLASLNSG